MLPDDWRPIDDYYVLCPEHLSPARPFHGEGAMRKCTEAKDDGFTVHRCWEDVGHECDHRSLGGYTWPVSTSGEVKP